MTAPGYILNVNSSGNHSCVFRSRSYLKLERIALVFERTAYTLDAASTVYRMTTPNVKPFVYNVTPDGMSWATDTAGSGDYIKEGNPFCAHFGSENASWVIISMIAVEMGITYLLPMVSVTDRE